eukprot:1152582-Pelagomonas_calceolata.AAC.8
MGSSECGAPGSTGLANEHMHFAPISSYHLTRLAQLIWVAPRTLGDWSTPFDWDVIELLKSVWSWVLIPFLNATMPGRHARNESHVWLGNQAPLSVSLHANVHYFNVWLRCQLPTAFYSLP